MLGAAVEDDRRGRPALDFCDLAEVRERGEAQDAVHEIAQVADLQVSNQPAQRPFDY